MEELITISKAADMTGMSYHALWQRIKSGNIVPHVWNGKKYIRREDVEALIEGTYEPKRKQN